MTSANVELVRSICADWERGDFSSAGWADPEIQYVIADGASPGSWTGLAGMAAAWRDVVNTVQDYRVVVDECRELDDERVLVFTQRSGHGRTSGVDLGQMGNQSVSVFHVRGGKVTRFVLYFDRDRALADLGLASEGPELVERVRGFLEAASRREWDAVLCSWAPNAVWDGSHQGVGTFEGVAAIRGLWDEWAGAYDEWGIEIEEIVDLSHGVVLAMVLQGGRPVDSAGQVQAHDAWVYEWVDGMVVRVTAYSRQDDGRAAAERLAEEGG